MSYTGLGLYEYCGPDACCDDGVCCQGTCMPSCPAEYVTACSSGAPSASGGGAIGYPCDDGVCPSPYVCCYLPQYGGRGYCAMPAHCTSAGGSVGPPQPLPEPVQPEPAPVQPLPEPAPAPMTPTPTPVPTPTAAPEAAGIDPILATVGVGAALIVGYLLYRKAKS